MARGPRTRRARWLRSVLLPAMVVLVGASWWAYPRVGGWRDERVARQAYGALAHCLLGAPLDEVSEPRRRLRAMAISASLDGAHAAWPARCEPHALRLEQSARALRGRRLAALGRGTGAQAPCVQDDECRVHDLLLEELGELRPLLRTGHAGAFEPERLAQAIAALDLGGGQSERSVPPPAPATLFDPRAMRPLYRGNYLRLLTDPAGDQDLDLLFYEHQLRYGLCTLNLASAEQARCQILPETIPVGFAGELLAAESGAPTLLYAQGPSDEGWTEALFDVVSGQAVIAVEDRPAGGFVWRDATVARLMVRDQEGKVELRVGAPGGEQRSATSSFTDAVSLGPRMVRDQIVWAVALGEGRHRLFVQPVRADEELFGPIIELGDTGVLQGAPVLDTCRTEQALVLLVTGQRSDRGVGAALAFRTDDGWQPVQQRRIGSGRYGFTCQGRRATLSWIGGVDEAFDPARLPVGAQEGRSPVRGQYDVHRTRCAPGGCSDEHVTIRLERHSSASRYVAGDLGSAMVVLWRSPLGDVRMRLAPLEWLPAAPDIPLFDDLEHEGFGWDLERDPIFGRSGAVIVLVSAPLDTTDRSATYGLRIDASGQATPVMVQYEGD